MSSRHTKHRQDKVLQELSSSAIPPAPIDIEELNKVGRHAEVRSWAAGGLGASLGFAQHGCHVQAGVGFLEAGSAQIQSVGRCNID